MNQPSIAQACDHRCLSVCSRRTLCGGATAADMEALRSQHRARSGASIRIGAGEADVMATEAHGNSPDDGRLARNSSRFC